MCGGGISAIIHGDLGLAPWDVLHQGVSEHTGIPVGTVIVIVGFVVLLAWIPLGVRPGLGTLLNAVLIGVVVDVIDPHLAVYEQPAARGGALAAGVVLFGAGSGLYIGAGLGPGPRDGLMTGLARRGHSIRLARTVLEVGVLAAGIGLGGSVGIGTAAFAFGIGPIVQYFLPRLQLDRAPTTKGASAGAAGERAAPRNGQGAVTGQRSR